MTWRMTRCLYFAMNQWQFEFFHVRIVCAGPSKRWDALQFTYGRFCFMESFSLDFKQKNARILDHVISTWVPHHLYGLSFFPWFPVILTTTSTHSRPFLGRRWCLTWPPVTWLHWMEKSEKRCRMHGRFWNHGEMVMFSWNLKSNYISSKEFPYTTHIWRFVFNFYWYIHKYIYILYIYIYILFLWVAYLNAAWTPLGCIRHYIFQNML